MRPRVRRPAAAASQGTVYDRPCRARRVSAACAGRWAGFSYLGFAMLARSLNPILNVSDMEASFTWFAQLGWAKSWDWGTPPTFGAVCSGECTIFLCLGGQGSRGKGSNHRTFGPHGDETADKGVWMSIWVENVDSVYHTCLEHGLDITWPPTDMPWNARELHIRHPDGHVLRVSQGLPETATEA